MADAYRGLWRRQFGYGRGKPAQLAAVRVAEERPGRKHGNGPDAVVLSDLLPIPDAMVSVDLPDGRSDGLSALNVLHQPIQ